MSSLLVETEFDPEEVAIAYVYTRVCRRCFLLAGDPVSGKTFDYPKVWIEEYSQRFASYFGVDLLDWTARQTAPASC
ncbi:hypothetical protein [Allorhodopirellula solitaria]|uniref:hypothetical protein n=1 Tax=Allorhodopirellula solitaria TaxID=2527987 RepID=UPI0011B75B02|nr:hypothetical protein [Allorhodopirellula solitaria]